MIYPNSNLPTVSQPWGRAVQKGIETLEATVKSNEVNNKARDAQLESSYKRLDTTVVEVSTVANSAQAAANAAAAAAATANSAATTANNAINAITSLGTPGSSTVVNASNISGGTIDATISITGAVIKSAASGARVEISGSSLKVYDASSEVASMYGSSSSFIINGGTNSVAIGDLGIAINGGGASVTVLDTGTNVSGGIDFLNSSTAHGTFTAQSGAIFQSTVSVSGSCDFNGGYARVGSGFLQVPDTRTRSATGGLAVFVAANGTYHVGSSSRRFKQDILDYTVDYDAFLKMNPVTFRYKSEVEEVGESAGTTVGFIAEELEELGLTEYVVLDNNGEPFGINYTNMVVGLKDVIAKQDEMIKSLTARIEALESKV